MMPDEDKSLVVITGASRGIGRAIALAIVDAALNGSTGNGENCEGQAKSTLPTPLRMVLIARSSESLRETALLIEGRCGDDARVSNDLVTTSCHELDLSDLDALPTQLQHILEPLSSNTQYDSCWLINNAGSLGPLGTASSMSGESSMKELRSAVDLNFTAGIWLSSQFTKTFLATDSNGENKNSAMVRIVNISSLCAIEPFSTMSIYCAGKAGRDMFHRVLAKEHSPSNGSTDMEDKGTDEKQTFKTLNWAPGPCDTQMTDNLVESSVLDSGLHKYFTTSKKEKSLVRPEDTARKLVQFLCLDEFESGSHVDFYDV